MFAPFANPDEYDRVGTSAHPTKCGMPHPLSHCAAPTNNKAGICRLCSFTLRSNDYSPVARIARSVAFNFADKGLPFFARLP